MSEKGPVLGEPIIQPVNAAENQPTASTSAQ